MAKESILKFLVYNGEIYHTNEIDLASKINRDSIYEVVRIIDGVPLYLNEHMERLEKSAKILGININRSISEIISDIKTLIEVNKENNMNVKIVCTCVEHGLVNIYVYFIKSFYPSKEMYDKGIKTILYDLERKNPNAKVSNIDIRSKINKEREKFDAFEALLVNHKGQITEGSRSNVFFVRDERLYTPPAGKVLLGVTRDKIFRLCSEKDIEIIEKDIYLDDLSSFDGGFITGTSINVLPIKEIDKINLKSTENKVILKVMQVYTEDMENHINKKI